MRNRNRAPIASTVLALVATAAAACVGQPRIDRADVERVESALAADAMEGRAAFTPAADRAAEYIAGELESTGLQPLDGLDGYLQSFSVRSLAVDTAAVELDGTSVPADDVVAAVSEEAITWTQADDVAVQRIEPDDDVMRGVFAARRSGGDALVLLDSSHRDSFDRLRGFLGRPTRALPSDEGRGSLVIALTDDTAADSFRVHVTATAGEEPLANVVGVIPGNRTDEMVLFSGHYDHLGIVDPVDGDAIANGANDDASGTTAVIELARYFHALGTPERTLVFAAFTAEESGGYGSRYFSRQLDPDQIVAMINIEMIGKVAAQGPKTVWLTGFDRDDLGTILQHAVEGTEYSFVADPYPEQNLFYRSDNATLARLGVPAHSFSTTPIDVDEDYHQVSDEIGTLDLDHMTDVIRAIALAVRPLVDGEATPTRIDASQVR